MSYAGETFHGLLDFIIMYGEFLRFYFRHVCKISRENFRSLLKICENCETFLLHNFSRLQYIVGKQRVASYIITEPKIISVPS